MKPIFVGLAALLFCLPLRAEEIELAQGESRKWSRGFARAVDFEVSDDEWEGGGAPGGRAETCCAYIPVGDLEEEGILLSIDFGKSSKPAALIIDCNGNGAVDKGERFLFEPAPPDRRRPHVRRFCAEKVVLPNGPDGKPIPVNVSCEIGAGPRHGEGDSGLATELEKDALASLRSAVEEILPTVELFVEAWECREGRADLGGVHFDIALIDRNINAAFSDFEEESGDESDLLVVASKESGPGASFVSAMPLRRKVVLNSRAFSIGVNRDGRKLVIEPIDVPFGVVSSPAADVEVTLKNPEWGRQTIPAGETIPLPAGEWSVDGFRRRAGKRSCSYTGPEKVRVHIAAGKKAAVELETRLAPAVKSRQRKKTVNLMLSLVTSQGARFNSYELPPSGGKKTAGVSFAIKDSSGRVVLEDSFEFG